MIALFKQKSPTNTIFLLLMGLLIKLPLFLYPKDVTATAADARLYTLLLSWLPDGSGRPMAAAVLAFVLLYVQALMVNYIVNEYRLTNRQTYLPAMAYLLITSPLPEWNYLSGALVACTFIIWSFILLLRLYNAATANGYIYNIGLLIGLGSFYFFPGLFLIAALLLGIMILRPFRANELLLCIAGLLTPYYFYAVYLFLTDKLIPARFFPAIELHLPSVDRSLWLLGSAVLLSIPFFSGGYFVQTHLRKILIQVRKNWSIMLLYLLLALFVPFINGTSTFEGWVMAVAPLAAFHAYAYLHTSRRWLTSLLFYLTVAFVIVQQFILPLWR